MDEFFGGMDGRFRVSITDSTMMRIVHCAMNKAHEKVKSKEGVIERLNGISKFYELAVMQLEGCIKFVQEEQDSYILESSHEEVLAGLTEIRNRLQGRLKESEMAIRDKDRELTERLECELKLRQALELKERELVSLRAKLKLNKLEKTKSEGAVDRDGGFCELKNSVDQQVWNIRQKLEPDYNKSRDKERDHEGVDNQKVEQMDSDIDILKETLDLAFGKMQNAIILSEFAPVEQQYRWSIEKDTISILLKGFMWDFEKKLEAKKWKQAKKVSIGGFDEVWSGLINEVAGLRDELKLLVSQNEVQVKSVESLQSNIGSKISNKGVEEANEVSDEDRNNFVAKMIKNHESIIRKKCEEAEVLNLLRREILREKGYSSCKKGKEQVSLKMKVQEVIAKLDSLIDWDAKIGESFDDHRDMQEEETSDGKDKVRANIDTLEDAWENIDKVFSAETKELYNKIRMLEQELEESNFEKMIIEETYLALSEGLQRDLVIHFSNHDLERMISENLFKDLVVDTVNQWNQKVESNNVEAEIREEVLCIVFNEAIKDFSLICDSNSAECDGLRAENSCLKESAFADKLDNLEGVMREDILIVIFDEMCKESSKRVNEYNDEVLVTEEICCFVFDETIKSIVDTACSELHQTEVLCIAFNEAIKDCGSICDSKSAECDGLRDENNCLKASAFADKLHNLEGTIREDILTVIFNEMYKESGKRANEYNEEVLVRDEICQFVFDETIKSIVDSKSAECEGLRHENSCLKASAFADKLDNLEGAIREDILTVIFNEMYKELSKRANEYNGEVLVRDEICHFVFDETIKSIVDSKSAECDGLRHENNRLKASAFADKLDNLEGAIREDILIVIFNEICKESSKRVDEYSDEVLVREDTCCFVFDETIKSIVDTAYSELHQCQEVKHAENSFHNVQIDREVSQCTECFIKEDVFLVFMRETIKQWEMELDAYNTESLLREEIFQLVISDAVVLSKEAAFEDQDKLMIFDKRLFESSQISKEEDLNRLELQEHLSDPEKVFHQTPTNFVQDKESSICESKENDEEKFKPSDSAFIHVQGFSKVMEDFEREVTEKLGMNMLRLERLKHQLNPLGEIVFSLRESESLYRKAFIRRCQNLRKAETEVDLLGDQVEVLVSLLEKVYTKLRQYSPVLQQYFEVSEIIHLIKKELNEVLHKPKY